MRKLLISMVATAAMVVGLAPLSASAAVTNVNLNVGGDGVIFPFAAGETALLTWQADNGVEVFVDGTSVGTFGAAVSSTVLDGNDFPKPARAEEPITTNTNNLGAILNQKTIYDVKVEIVESITLVSVSMYVDVARGYVVTATNEREAKVGTKGKNFTGMTNSECDISIGKVGLIADCRNPGDRLRAFYRLSRPELFGGEWITGRSHAVKYWDGGLGFFDDALLSGNRVRVNLHSGFLGQVRRVSITSFIDANDSFIEV